MKTVESDYNLFIPYDNEHDIVFNTFSGAIGLFDKELVQRFNEGRLSEKETSTLLEKGILIQSSYSEIEKINKDRIEGIKTSKDYHFRIWTTSGCNARCFYCFERGIEIKTMDSATAERVVEFIEERISDDSQLHIEWFGGEPLCNVGVIDEISEKLIKICEERNIKYHASMISNGSLIDENVAYKISKKWKIESIQITFDGYRELYNTVKNYVNSYYNFDKVIQGIEYLMKYGIHISIRMNYTTDNYASLLELVDFLHERFAAYKNIFYYAYPVWDSIDENAEGAFKSKTRADKHILEIFDKLIHYKMSPAKQLFRLRYRKYQCASCCEKSYTILPDGKLTKCSESYLEPIGDIWNGVERHDLEKLWTSIEIDQKCKECIYLPICQGGCRSAKFTAMPQCFAYKEIVPDMVKWYVNYLKGEKEKAKI